MSTNDPLIGELTVWLEANWDPDLSVAEWWERLGTSGWGAPYWPVGWCGKGVSRDDAVRAQRAIASFGALPAPGGLGMQLAGPTIVTHGTDAQKARYLEDIVTGRKAWCQLFSEPAAGSDLAGLQARAERDGDEWVVNGQKVWTSGGHHADLGMLIARTNPDAPKHKGITYFAIDMDQPGIDVRPLREMTGRALFNEVFLTDARVPHDGLVGGLHDGWTVANTTLAYERTGLGAGGSGAASAAYPGSKMGHLGKRAGDFVTPKGREGNRRSASAATGGLMFGSAFRLFADIARKQGTIDDPTIRNDLARLYTLNEIGRFTSLRVAGAKAKGKAPGAEGSTAKLAMSNIIRLVRDLGPRVLGPAAALHGYEAADQARLADALGDPTSAIVTGMMLFSPAPSIYGGTDQVQRNIIGERVLGLPKEPGDMRDVPFRDLPRNAQR